MKKLRLLFTKDCNRNCKGCCNKEYNLNGLPIVKDYKLYDEIIITGGEPMLYPRSLEMTIYNIKLIQGSKAKIYIYTALVNDIDDIERILPLIDGLTITIHTNDDIQNVLYLAAHLEKSGLHEDKSMRLNVFKEANMPIEAIEYLSKYFTIKNDIEWIKSCPLPKDEVFMKMSN